MDTKIVIPEGFLLVDQYQRFFRIDNIISVSLLNGKYWDDETKSHLVKIKIVKASWWQRIFHGVETKPVSISYEYIASPPYVIINLSDGKEVKFSYKCRQDALDSLASIMLEIQEQKSGEVVFS